MLRQKIFAIESVGYFTSFRLSSVFTKNKACLNSVFFFLWLVTIAPNLRKKKGEEFIPFLGTQPDPIFEVDSPSQYLTIIKVTQKAPPEYNRIIKK